MSERCPRPGCSRQADHLVAPGAEIVCREHYREQRPYTVSRAALETFDDMLTPGERAKWQRIVNDQDQEAEARAHHDGQLHTGQQGMDL